jgi:hypothetical protein
MTNHDLVTPDKIRLDKIRKEEDKEGDKSPSPRFKPPTLSQVTEYCKARQNKVDPVKWLSHYEANGWRVGKVKMKDWQASIRTWERNSFDQGTVKSKLDKRTMLDIDDDL